LRTFSVVLWPYSKVNFSVRPFSRSMFRCGGFESGLQWYQKAVWFPNSGGAERCGNSKSKQADPSNEGNIIDLVHLFSSSLLRGTINATKNFNALD
jgi:hypothetical protein